MNRVFVAPSRITILLIATIVVACNSLAPSFSTTLVGGDTDDLGVSLRDGTGLVESLEPGVPGPEDFDVRPLPEVVNDAAERKTLLVRWLGGLCDDRMELSFEPAAEGYMLRSHPVGELTLGCPAAGVVRVVRIVLSTEVDAAEVAVSGE